MSVPDLTATEQLAKFTADLEVAMRTIGEGHLPGGEPHELAPHLQIVLTKTKALADELMDASARAHQRVLQEQARQHQRKIDASRSASDVRLQNQRAEMQHVFVAKLQKVGCLHRDSKSSLFSFLQRGSKPSHALYSGFREAGR